MRRGADLSLSFQAVVEMYSRLLQTGFIPCSVPIRRQRWNMLQPKIIQAIGSKTKHRKRSVKVSRMTQRHAAKTGRN
ncbi:unnamed protein product [Boreogadus saida]